MNGRPVFEVPLPGFRDDEALPATAEAAVGALARSVLAAADGQPFVLLGYSNGGILAYAVTEWLVARLGARPEAVVVLDSFDLRDSGQIEGLVPQMLNVGLAAESRYGDLTITALSAMYHWNELLIELELDEVDVPVLFVQCTLPFSDAVDAWRTRPFGPGHQVRTIEAHHFSMLVEHCADTASLVQDWLEVEVGKAPPTE
jgi:polyene macrolide polyketide synthase